MPPTPAELLGRVRRAEFGTPEWILYAAAAFDAVVEHPMILVGGGAQVVYTQIPRPTDVDLVGRITSRDLRALEEAGFVRHGRHWLHAWKREEVLVEVPGLALLGEDPPTRIDVGGHELRVISLEDLLVDRLVQATDRTDVTWDEALSLAAGTHRRADWERVRERCMARRTEDLGLHILPQVLDDVLDKLKDLGLRPA